MDDSESCYDDDNRCKVDDPTKLVRLQSYLEMRESFCDIIRTQWDASATRDEIDNWFEQASDDIHNISAKADFYYRVFRFDARKLWHDTVADMALVETGQPAFTAAPPPRLPGVGTSVIPDAVLQQVHGALCAVRQELAQHPSKTYQYDTMALESRGEGVMEAWHNIVDPRLYCFEKACPLSGEDFAVFTPTRYSHSGGAGFVRAGFINGAQLTPVAASGDFDAAAKALLEAAFPLLAQTPYIAQGDDGGVSAPLPCGAHSSLTPSEAAEVEEFTAVLLQNYKVVCFQEGKWRVTEDADRSDDDSEDAPDVVIKPGFVAVSRLSAAAHTEPLRDCPGFMAELAGVLDHQYTTRDDDSIHRALGVAVPPPTHPTQDTGSEGGDGRPGTPPQGKRKRKADATGNPWDMAYNGTLDGLKESRWICRATANYHHRDHGTTLLYTAARFGHTAVCEWLLSQGADPNTPCADSKARSTPLHGACFGGHPETVALLLQSGADPSAENAHGDTPLDDAKATQGSPAEGRKCQKVLSDFARAQQQQQEDEEGEEEEEERGMTLARQLVEVAEKHAAQHPDGFPGGIREAVVLAAHRLLRPPHLPDLKAAVLKRRQMEAHRAARPCLGGLLQNELGVVWQAADIRLAPESTAFTGTPLLQWGEDRANCAATVVLVVACDNVSPSVIRVKEPVDQSYFDGQTDMSHYPLACGLEEDLVAARMAAVVPLVPGTLVAMHRQHLHEISSFRLLDSTKPGSVTLLYMMVADPHGEGCPPATSEMPDPSEWVAPRSALDHARVMLARRVGSTLCPEIPHRYRLRSK